MHILKNIIVILFSLILVIPLTAGESYSLVEGQLYKNTPEGMKLIKDGLPRRMVYPFKEKTPEILTGMDSRDEEIWVTTGTSLLYSSNGLGGWQSMAHRSQFGRYAYFTSVAVNNSNRIALGTSFHGLYESTNGGKDWTDLSEKIKFMSPGAGYYDDISEMVYLGDRLYFAGRLGTELYSYAGGIVQQESTPDDSRIMQLYRIENQLYCQTVKASYRKEGELWVHQGDGFKSPQPSETEKARMAKAANKNGMYLSSWQARKNLDSHMAFAKEKGLNALVIDMKDDMGRITYNSSIDMVKDIGALLGGIDIEDLVRRTHENGLYLIARVVVFKDVKLYHYDNKRLALWDVKREAPWGRFVKVADEETGEEKLVQREFWVDAFSEEVWDYNIAIAKELQSKGVDEIQFDYIRFPSDGSVQNILFRHQKDGMDKMDALESFLKKAREEIHIPISTDVFGFNGWYVMDYLGQNIERFSKYVDVICPMSYPSHFHKEFLNNQSYNERARNIYYTGTLRAGQIVGDRALIRPYVQAFLIYHELKMEEPEYVEYLHKQLEGNKAAGGSGFLLWNQSGRYYMVTKELTEYTN